MTNRAYEALIEMQRMDEFYDYVGPPEEEVENNLDDEAFNDGTKKTDGSE